MLDEIDAIMVSYLGPLGPLLAVGILGMFLILLALPLLLRRERDPLDRLKAETRPRGGDPARPDLRRRGGGEKLAKYSNLLEPKDEAELSAIRLKLMRAGYRTKSAVRIYHFAQFALGGVLLAAGGLYALVEVSTSNPSTPTLIAIVAVPGLIGYYGPKYWVQRRLQTRQQEIENGFPDSLDMMLVCIEAGQSLDQAIVRVARELGSGFPALAEEYEIVAQEMKAGKDKSTVLRDMSDRAGVNDVASFVTVLIQSQQFGTPISEALRVYSAEMRDKRVMRAEEKANTLPTKMTLATMMLTVPPLMVILVGPSIYAIATQLGGGAF